MKWLVAAVIGSVAGCGGPGGGSATAPTPAPPPANISGSYHATITASSRGSAHPPSGARALDYGAIITGQRDTRRLQMIRR